MIWVFLLVVGLNVEGLEEAPVKSLNRTIEHCDGGD